MNILELNGQKYVEFEDLIRWLRSNKKALKLVPKKVIEKAIEQM